MQKYSHTSRRVQKELGGSVYALAERVDGLETEIGDSTYTGNSITAAINALQTKVSTTSWTLPNLINGVINYNGDTQYKRFGDIVTIDLHLKVPAENTSVVAFNISTTYRPNAEKNFVVTSGGTADLVTYVKIAPNGNVTVSVSGSGNQYAIGTITFMK